MGSRLALTPVPEKTAEGMTMLETPETCFPDNPIIPAGLFAITLGSSVEAAAPAKAVPSAETLFSRSWNPDAQPASGKETPDAAAPKAAASHLRDSPRPHLLATNMTKPPSAAE